MVAEPYGNDVRSRLKGGQAADSGTPAGQESARHGSQRLRRQWLLALGLMIGVLTLALTGTSIAYLQVIDQYETAAHQLDGAVTLSSNLQKAGAAHEGLAHALWNGEQIDHALYLRQQAEISRMYDRGLHEITRADQARLLAEASRTWKSVLQRRGLWGPEARPLAGVTLAMQQRFGSDSDQVTVTLSRLSTVAIADSTAEITHADSLETRALWLLIGLFALVVALAGYLARRLTTDVLRPIRLLHRAVLRLRDGEFERTVGFPVSRHPNELSELADAFDAMAVALEASHRLLSHEATHDSLTGIANRAVFEQRLEEHFVPGNERRGDGISVLFIDIDDFKHINDSFGHAGGDAVLSSVAERLSSCARSTDLVARLGGDEFAILVVDRGSEPSSAVEVGKRVLESLSAPFVVSGQDVGVRASIGIGVKETETDSAAQLLAEADFAMYMAKGHGKNQYVVFDARIHGRAPVVQLPGSRPAAEPVPHR